MNKPPVNPVKVEKDIPEFLKESNNNTSKIANSNPSTNSMKIPKPQSKNTKTKNDFDNLEELEIWKCGYYMNEDIYYVEIYILCKYYLYLYNYK